MGTIVHVSARVYLRGPFYGWEIIAVDTKGGEYPIDGGEMDDYEEAFAFAAKKAAEYTRSVKESFNCDE